MGQPLNVQFRSYEPRQSRIGASDVRRVLKLRRSRNEIFCKALFGEPAWDMLLQLYAAQLERRTECITDLCDASGVPQSTALRWISCLEDRKLVKREHDPRDNRRILVSLTAKGAEAMDRFFTQAEFFPDQPRA